MSSRSPGNPGSSGSSRRNVAATPVEVGPPLVQLIGACALVGALALILAFLFSPNTVPASNAVGTPAQTAAGAAAGISIVPTDAPPAVPTTAAVSAGTVGQGGAAGSGSTDAEQLPAVPTAPFGPAVGTGDGQPVAVGSNGEQLLFAETSLQATGNTLYTLSFKNNSSAVPHNWVLVNSDSDEVADAVNSAAQSQVSRLTGALAALPPVDTPDVLAGMPFVAPGQTGSVTFTAPPPGTYLYICTYPGHYLAGMKGELVVE